MLPSRWTCHVNSKLVVWWSSGFKRCLVFSSASRCRGAASSFVAGSGGLDRSVSQATARNRISSDDGTAEETRKERGPGKLVGPSARTAQKLIANERPVLELELLASERRVPFAMSEGI